MPADADAPFAAPRPDDGELIPDAVLLRRYAEGRAEDAFAELVRRHLDGVYSAALRRVGGDTHLAQDVAQQVFVALARKAPELTCHPVLTGWLYLTTRNEAANIVRTERRRKAREQHAHAMQDLPASGPPATADADWSRVAPLLDTVIDELPEADRTALLLRFIDRRPFAEIGRVLRLSDDATRMRVDRALDKLRARLARRGILSTSAALGLALAQQAVHAAPPGFAAGVTTTALSATASTLSPAAAFITFMSTSKIAVASAALLLVLGLGGSLHQLNANRSADAALLVLQDENRLLAARLRERRELAESAESAAAARQQALDAARAEQQRVARAATQARQQASRAEGEAFMARHPELLSAAREMWRADAAGQYEPLLRALKLSAEQIEQFKDIALQGSFSTTGANGQSMTFSLALEPAQRETELRALLGEAGYQRYKKWDQEYYGGYRQVAALATALYRTEAPLTPDQGDALRRIMADAWQPVAWSKIPQFNWDDITRRSRAILSERQLTELGYIQAEDVLSQAQTRARSAAGTLPPNQ